VGVPVQVGGKIIRLSGVSVGGEYVAVLVGGGKGLRAEYGLIKTEEK